MPQPNNPRPAREPRRRPTSSTLARPCTSPPGPATSSSSTSRDGRSGSRPSAGPRLQRGLGALDRAPADALPGRRDLGCWSGSLGDHAGETVLFYTSVNNPDHDLTMLRRPVRPTGPGSAGARPRGRAPSAAARHHRLSRPRRVPRRAGLADARRRRLRRRDRGPALLQLRGPAHVGLRRARRGAGGQRRRGRPHAHPGQRRSGRQPAARARLPGRLGRARGLRIRSAASHSVPYGGPGRSGLRPRRRPGLRPARPPRPDRGGGAAHPRPEAPPPPPCSRDTCRTSAE